MTEGLLLPPGAGSRIEPSGLLVKIGAERSSRWSVFEMEVLPGFDVGAHVHGVTEELFYILDGELDLLAFEPLTRTSGDWQRWESADGTKVVRGGPGSMLFVPSGCPHAFANPGESPARILFLTSPSGHEVYLRELAELLAVGGPPDPRAIAELRARHDMEQITPVVPPRGRRPAGPSR